MARIKPGSISIVRLHTKEKGTVASIQFKISLRKETAERLESARARFGKRTTNIIASEVINDYLHLWLEAEASRKKKVARQYDRARKRRDS